MTSSCLELDPQLEPEMEAAHELALADAPVADAPVADAPVADAPVAERVEPTNPAETGFSAGPRIDETEELWARLVEVSAARGRGCFTTAVSNLIAAQQRDEPTAWVHLEPGVSSKGRLSRSDRPLLAGGALYPPDLADSGVDLDALLVVQAPSPKAQLRAAELLLRSGAFGLIVLDLTYAGSTGLGGVRASLNHSSSPRPSSPRPSSPHPSSRAMRSSRVSDSAWQSRLAALAREHQSRILVLSSQEDDAPSLGPMVSLRLAPRWERRSPGKLWLDQVVLKNKGGAPLGHAGAPYRTPAGML